MIPDNWQEAAEATYEASDYFKPLGKTMWIRAFEAGMNYLEEKYHPKEIKPRCIYCKKTSTESGLMQMMINAPGIWVQCFDIRKEGREKYCPENTRYERPDGSCQIFDEYENSKKI